MSLTCVQEWSLMRTIFCYTNTLNVCKCCLILSSCLYRAMSLICVQEWSLMRTIFCYTNTLWDLYKKKDIDKIEKMLRRAARFALNRHNKTSSVKEVMVELKVKEMMVELKWPTGYQRKSAGITTATKSHHRDGKAACGDWSLLTPSLPWCHLKTTVKSARFDILKGQAQG